MPAKKPSSGRVTPKGTQATPPRAPKPEATPTHRGFDRDRSGKGQRVAAPTSAPRSGRRGNR